MTPARPTAAVFTLQGLGNSVLALPLVMSLARTYEVTVHVKRNGSERLYEELPLGVAVRSYASRAELFRSPFPPADCAVAAVPTGRSESLGLARTPARRRVSFRGRWSLLNFALRPPPAAHDVDNNAKLGERLGVPSPPINLGALFRGTAARSEGHLVAIHPTASTPAKYYPLEFWRGVVDELLGRGREVRIFAGAGAEEQKFALQVARAGGAHVPTYLGAPVTDVARMIASAETFVGSDSALMHIAALAGVQTVGLWSFADIRRVHPYGVNTSVYVPREVLTSRNFAYPDRAPEWLARARVDDVLRVIDGANEPDFTLPAPLAAPARIYVY